MPFTKDLSYLKGFILIYNYIQLAVRKGKLEQIPLLFCGKTTLEDMRALRQLVDEGMVVPPSTCRHSSVISMRCRPGCASPTSSIT